MKRSTGSSSISQHDIVDKLASFSMTRRRLLGSTLAAGAAAAIGTGGSTHAFAQGTEPLSIFYTNFPVIDPQVVTNGMWFDAIFLLEGLTTIGAGGTEAVPAAAESWDVSADGTVYTFHLRAGATWSNGDPVKAQDFEWTYQRILTPQTGSSTGVTLGANSYQPILRIVGAVDFLSGVGTDWTAVGIKAVDDATLEITIENPNAEFPLLLTHPSMLPLHPASVQDTAKDWHQPENFVGNGPFVPTSWTINTDFKMIPNEKYWDRATVTLPGVNVRLVEGANDTASVAYEAGEVDFIGLTMADLIRYQADPELSQQITSVEGGSIYYLATLRSRNPILEDVNIRKALSIALDRATVASINPATAPAGQLMPTTMVGFDPANDTPFDVEQAKQILADAGYPDGEGFPEVKILLGGTASPQMEGLVDILGKALNIKVSLDVVESGVYVERRWQVQEEDYIGFYFGSYGSTPTWSTWVANLWGPQFIQEFSMKSADWAAYQTIQNDTTLAPADKTAKLTEMRETKASPEALAYGAKVDEAFTQPDPAQQQALLQEAATIRQETYLIIPFAYGTVFYAVKPNISGLELLPGGLAYYSKTIAKA
jgi:ABC-type transport system substrate-binding protein